MRYMLQTQVNESGNTVFVKQRKGNKYQYLATSEFNETHVVTKDWVLENRYAIINVGVSNNNIYPTNKRTTTLKVDVHGMIFDKLNRVHPVSKQIFNVSDLYIVFFEGYFNSKHLIVYHIVSKEDIEHTRRFVYKEICAARGIMCCDSDEDIEKQHSSDTIEKNIHTAKFTKAFAKSLVDKGIITLTD